MYVCVCVSACSYERYIDKCNVGVYRMYTCFRWMTFACFNTSISRVPIYISHTTYTLGDGRMIDGNPQISPYRAQLTC